MEPPHLDIGEKWVWGGTQPFGLSADDRRRHLYIIGQTGTGKSTLMRELMAQDAAGGAGCALIDPHGDLSAEVLERIPPARIDDVVLLDPSDIAHPVGFNPFYRVPLDERPRVADNLVATMRHIWRESWGPRLEYILYHATRALLDVETRQLRPTLLALPRLLVDGEYRARVVAEIEDIETRRFFTEEFARWNERQLAEYLGSSQNKIGQLVANPFLRNIFGQWRPSVDLSAAIAERKILIVRLSKGTLGEQPANLFGALVATGLLQAAMRQADRPEAQRAPFHLYIDEFQNFTTDSFASILSEARKYALTLTVAHQYLDQLPAETAAAVFGNVGSLVSFRVAGGDAERLSHEIGHYAPGIYRDLGRGRVCARLTERGEAGQAFRGETYAGEQPVYGCKDTIQAQCRQRYSVPREQAEARVARWLQS